MKILFVISDLSFADHISIAYLSAIARQQNHLTFFCPLDSRDLTASVDQIHPDIVAYSVNISGFTRAVAAHKKARKTNSFISIMGGPHPTNSPETFPGSGMDAYCIGEGEYPFADFLVKVERGESFNNIANLITKDTINPVRPLITNLDELPPLDRDLVLSNSFLKNTSKKTFYATRGCPFNCAYCCNNYYHRLYRGKGPPVRRHSVERIIQEIEDVKNKYRMDFVKFGDDCFVLKADDWLEEFSEKYAARIGIPFNCYLRLDTVDDTMLRLLRKAGCFSAHLSVDSTSQYVREKILKRKMLSEDIVGRLRKIREYGINTWVNFMLAVPGSTLQDDLDTIKLSKEGKVTYPAYSTTVPMEKTELYDYCLKLGIIDPAAHVGDMSGCSEKSTLSCFSEREKNIRYNIYLMGAVAAKLPFPIDKFVSFIIKAAPPNIVFSKINSYLYRYYIENKIFKLSKDGRKISRFLKRTFEE